MTRRYPASAWTRCGGCTGAAYRCTPAISKTPVPPLHPGAHAPLHKIALVRLGMPLIDAANVEELAAVCTELSRYSFLLAAAPPRILGMTGVPVNPLAIF
jgi:hypothetical protein